MTQPSRTYRKKPIRTQDGIIVVINKPLLKRLGFTLETPLKLTVEGGRLVVTAAVRNPTR